MSINKQAIFNKTYRHFIYKGGKMGWDKEHGICVYGKPGDENRCAIGIHDTKGALSKVNGDVTANSVLPRLGRVFKGFPRENYGAALNFLRELQIAHDDTAIKPKTSLAKRLKQVANQFGLTIPSK